MKREEIIQRLTTRRERLRAMGVESLALFGSTARNEFSEGSDIDLMVSFSRPVSLFDYADLAEYLSQIMGDARIDLVERKAVLEELREPIFREAIPCL